PPQRVVVDVVHARHTVEEALRIGRSDCHIENRPRRSGSYAGAATVLTTGLARPVGLSRTRTTRSPIVQSVDEPSSSDDGGSKICIHSLSFASGMKNVPSACISFLALIRSNNTFSGTSAK